MTGPELLALRGVLVQRRQALLDQLATDAAGKNLLEPAFLSRLADIQTAIAAIGAVLAEPVNSGGAPWER